MSTGGHCKRPCARSPDNVSRGPRLSDMRKVAVALLLRHSHASTIRTGPAPFIPSRSLVTHTNGEVSMGRKTRKKRESNKSSCSKQELGGSQGPSLAEVVAGVAGKASCKAQDLGLVLTRKRKPADDYAKAGRALAARKTEEHALSKQATVDMSFAQEPLREIMARLDLNTYRWGKQWEEASRKLLDYGIPPTYIARMLAKCGNVTCFVHRVDSSLNHLSLLGVSHTRIGRIISNQPTILNTTDSLFRLKLEFLESIGIDRHILSKGLVSVLRYSLPLLRRNAVFWKDYMAEVHTEAVPIMISKDPHMLTHSIGSKISWFESQEFDKMLLLKRPRILGCSQHLLIAKAEILKRFGISDARKRARALCEVSGIGTSTLQARYRNLLAAGFSCDQVRSIISNCPTVLTHREVCINAKLNYAVKVMNTPLKEIISSVLFWGISLEKRLKPRYEVVKELQALGARECGICLGYLISMSDLSFQKRFVDRYQYVWEHGKALNA